MTVPRTVAEALDEHLTLEVECIDRMHVNLYRRSVHVRLAYRTPRQNDAAAAGTGRSERHRGSLEPVAWRRPLGGAIPAVTCGRGIPLEGECSRP